MVKRGQNSLILGCQLLQHGKGGRDPFAVHPDATLGRHIIEAKAFDEFLLVQELAGVQEPQVLLILPLVEEDPGARTLQGLPVPRSGEESTVRAAHHPVDELDQNVLGILKQRGIFAR